MTEPVTKRVNVTFHDGLPGGTRGIFTYNKEQWIALPHNKYTRIVTVIDRLIGTLSAIGDDMIGLINAHPEDAVHVAQIAGRVRKARILHRELATEKCRSQTL